MQVERSYAVPRERLLALVTDEEFLAARAARFGGLGAPLLRRNGDAVEIAVTRQLPLHHVPGAFKRFVGDGRLVEHTRWDCGESRAEWHADTGRAPLSIAGTQVVAAADSGSRHVVTAQIEVRLPLGRDRLTRLVETHLADLIRAELAFADDWLGPA